MKEQSALPIKRKRMTRTAPTIALGFLFLILVGAFFLCLPISHKNGSWFPFIDAFFTATSAVCVTGLVVADTAVQFSIFGQIIILFLIQVGGLGFMTGAVIVFMAIGKKITLHERMVLQESISHYRLQGVVDIVRKMILYTFAVEGIGMLMLLITFAPMYGFWDGLYKSVFHSISAFCNAGFDILGTAGGEQFLGLTRVYDQPGVLIPIMLMIIFGGIGFVVVSELFTRKKNRALSLHTKVVLLMTGILIGGGAILFLALEWNGAFAGMTVGEKILSAFFQAVTPRTAGFNSVDQASLGNASSILTSVFMFIGASPASTGGGIKTTTAFLLIFITTSAIKGRKTITISKSNINETMMKKSIGILMIALTVVCVVSFGISAFEGASKHAEIMTLENIIFESISAFATVGLSKGITPYLTIGSKLCLCFAMFVGRVGTLTMGAAIARGVRSDVRVQYTDAKLMLG